MQKTTVRIILVGRGIEGERALARVLGFLQDGLERAGEGLGKVHSSSSIVAANAKPNPGASPTKLEAR